MSQAPRRKIRMFSAEPWIIPKRTIRAFNRDGTVPDLTRDSRRGPASEIIQDSPFTSTRAESVARARVIRTLREGMQREGGYIRMLGHLTLCEEITGYGVFSSAKCAALERERAEYAAFSRAKELSIEKVHIRRLAFEARDKLARDAYRRAHPPSSVRHGLRLIDNRGGRIQREEALTEDDLYLTDARPVEIGYARLAHLCSLCHGVKSHPVIYPCKHSHCYVCIRISLETSWACPECKEGLRRAPLASAQEAASIAEDHGNWDPSEVSMSWKGLSFPRPQF
ncbi:hypothetical protein DFH06DRAFT_1328182 [Mycena polygramma]|nr:hypothetical protein DFH06DRAFT_1328182 [Mycena polygramma]